MISLLLLITASIFNLVLNDKLSKVFNLITVVLSFVLFLNFCNCSYELDFIGLKLTPILINDLSFLLISVFHIVAFTTLIYSWQSSTKLENAAALFYFASAVGLVGAGDLFSFFLFWEFLTIGAVLLILCSPIKDAGKAASRYFLFHVIGGLLLLAGIFGRYFLTSDVKVEILDLKHWYNILIFLGIGVNCGFPLLHTWITDAYPKASPSGTVWMSAITTKTAVYALLVMFPGEKILIWIGAVMMVFPVFYAVIENNIRKVLSYSLINQVGLIVTGIGLGTTLATSGAAAHIVTDIFFKALLFMSIGAVLYRTKVQTATDLGGLYKSMPLTCIFCVIGALSISAFPFFSGFISKSLIVSAAYHENQFILWLVLLFASAAVLEHAGIKVPFFTFFAHDSGKRPKEAPPSMLFAMGLISVFCMTLGIFPELLYSYLPSKFDYQVYTLDHIITQMELLLFAALAFVLMLLAGLYPSEKRGPNLDFDYFYKKLFKKSYACLDKFSNALNQDTEDLFHKRIYLRIIHFIKHYPGNIFSIFTRQSKHWHEAVLDGTLPIALSIFFALLLFVSLMW